MLRQFFKDSATYGVSAVLSRGLSLFLLPIYTRFLAPADYGVMDLVLTLAAAANLVVALEISQGIARYYPETPDADEKRSYASTALWFTFVAYGVFLLAMLLFSRQISSWLLGTPDLSSVFSIAAAAITLNGVFFFLQNQLRWQLLPRKFAEASVTYSLVTAAATVSFLLFAGWGVAAVFLGQIVGATAGILLSWHAARHSYQLEFRWEKCREMLTFSLPLVPSGVAVFVSLYIDRIAIRHLMTLDDVGLFGVGYRVASAVGIILLGTRLAITPLIYSKHREPGTPGEIAAVFRYFLAAVLIPVLVLAVFSREILAILAAPSYQSAHAVVPLLAAATLLSQMYVFAPGLALAKRTGHIAGISVFSAVTNTILNFVFIPRWGIVGAASATMSSAALGFALYMVASQRLYYVPHQWDRIVCAVVACMVGAGIANLLFDQAAAMLHSAAPSATKFGLVIGCTTLILVLLVGTRELRSAAQRLPL